MRLLDIDSLFGDTHPHASFHDSEVHKISIDLLAREVRADCLIHVGDPDDREAQPRAADGALTFTGLLYFAAEPPDARYPYEEGGLDISYDGPVEVTNFKAAVPRLPGPLPDDAFNHCFFVNNWNSFIFVAATGARFDWA